MAIRAGTLSHHALMELTFEVVIARFTESTLSTSLDTPQSWFTLPLGHAPRRVKCDIMPLNDLEYFTQSGDSNQATHSLHFYAREDIKEKDRVLFVHSRRLAGPVGSWFEVSKVLSPTETIAFTRVYAYIIDAPPNLAPVVL